MNSGTFFSSYMSVMVLQYARGPKNFWDLLEFTFFPTQLKCTSGTNEEINVVNYFTIVVYIDLHSRQ